MSVLWASETMPHHNPLPLPSSLPTSRRQVSTSHTSFVHTPPKNLTTPQSTVLPDPRYLGKHHSRSLAFKSKRIWGGAGCVRLGPAPQADWGFQKGGKWEWVKVTRPSTLIKNGLYCSERIRDALCIFTWASQSWRPKHRATFHDHLCDVRKKRKYSQHLLFEINLART